MKRLLLVSLFLCVVGISRAMDTVRANLGQYNGVVDDVIDVAQQWKTAYDTAKTAVDNLQSQFDQLNTDKDGLQGRIDELENALRLLAGEINAKRDTVNTSLGALSQGLPS